MTLVSLCNNNLQMFEDNNNVLYELQGQCEWIGDIIHEYNQLGFYTVTSQPGSDDGIRKQRAYIRGYMSKDKAIHITNLLKDHEYLHVRNTIYNPPFSDICKLGSVRFKNGHPTANDMDTATREDDASFNLKDPLHRPLQRLESEVYEFDIVDKRWNDNTILWTTLLQCLNSLVNN